jgi:hypothetical protein
VGTISDAKREKEKEKEMSIQDDFENAMQGNSNFAEEKCVCVIRLTTSYWYDNKGLHYKKSLNVLKRKSAGYQVILEDCSNIGADEVFPRITNLEECKDGIYQVVTCNEKRDWETGAVDDYDYQLIKYEEQKDKNADSNQHL